MTKARSLADLMADGNSLADGVVSVAEVSGAAPLASPSFTGDISVTGTVDGRDVAADGTKLDGVEVGATADQSASDIRSLVEAATDSNVFTDADHTKLDGVEAGADVTDTANVVGSLTAGSNITIAADGTIAGAAQYTHPTHPGDDASVDTGVLSGATVISDLDFNITTDTDGHVTDANASVATRTLTLTDLGYTGATNANYITNNNQLSNGAGYTTNVGDITNVSAGTNLTGGGSSGSVTVNLTASPNITSLNVGGTEVVSSSRALKNIASVDATTAAAIGAAGVGGGGTMDFVADGGITAGNMVGLTADGKAKVVTGLTGADFVFTTSDYYSNKSRISGMSSTKAVVIYVDNSGNIKGKVATIGSTTISYGSEFTVSNSQSPGYLYSVYEPNSDKVLCTWRNDGTGQYYMKAVVVSVSGTSGSVGSVVTVDTNSNYEQQLLPRPGSNPQVLVAYRGGTPGNLRLLTISGTSISVGSNQTAGDAFRRAAWISSTRIWKLSGSYGRYASYNDLSGTSFGVSQANTDIYTGGWDRTELWWDSLNSKLVRVVADAGGFRMEAYNASSSISLAGTTVLNPPGEGFGGSTVPAYYSAELNRGIFKFRPASSSSGQNYIAKVKIENNAPVFDTQIPVDEFAQSFSNAGGNVLFTTQGVSPDPAYGRASFVNFGSTMFSFIGFASNTVSDGQTVTVDIVGGENTSQSGLSTGSYYGITNDGTLSAGAAGPIGVATSATSILVQPGRDA